METQHHNNVVDLMLFQLYCHVASNPNGNAASRRLSTRPDDLTQVLVEVQFDYMLSWSVQEVPFHQFPVGQTILIV